MNDVDPQAWLADVLARLPDYPANKVADLLPWNWKANQQHRADVARAIFTGRSCLLVCWAARTSVCAQAGIGRQRDQLCQLSEVLDCSSEEELVLSTGRASQPGSVQAQRCALDVANSISDLCHVRAATSRRSRSWRCRAQRLGRSRKLIAGPCGRASSDNNAA